MNWNAPNTAALSNKAVFMALNIIKFKSSAAFTHCSLRAKKENFTHVRGRKAPTHGAPIDKLTLPSLTDKAKRCKNARDPEQSIRLSSLTRVISTLKLNT